MPQKTARYGWLRDLPNPSDVFLAAPAADTVAQFPATVDLRANCPGPYNQGNLGSCTANAVAGAVEFQLMKESLSQVFTPSRLFIYYYERASRGTVAYDSGASIRDGIQVVSNTGYPPETAWPYDESQFATAPSADAQSQAAVHKAFQSFCLNQTLDHLRGTLADGEPFVFGMTIFSSFESPEVASSGQVPMPGPTEETIGGHAMMGVGYDDEGQFFWVRNSWGDSWGIGGYCQIPYSYLTNPQLAADFWTIRTVD